MSAYLCPLFNEPQVDANGAPLSGGKVFAFAAGSTTPQTTYTDSTGTTPQTNPIILNSRGVPASPIWLAGGVAYKFVLQDANGVVLAPTFDGIQGINDPAAASSQDQWVFLAVTPTFLSATTFSVPGDQTGTLQVGRRVKTTNSGGTVYSTITASVFTAVTTVTLVNDSSSLDAGLSTVSYGLLSATGPSLPQIRYPAPNNRIINGACLVSQYGSKAIANATVTYGGCDRIGFAATATAASGTLSQQSPAVAGIGTYGKVQSATITTTGSTTLLWLTRMEAKHVMNMGGQSVIFACKVYQNSGSTLSYTPILVKASALDNFSTTTGLTIGSATQVPSGVPTTVFMRATISPGDADNGLQIGVSVAAFNAVTGKQFDISDLFFDVGSSVMEYQMQAPNVTTETLRCQRYYWPVTGESAGISANTTQGVFAWNLPVPMRTTPTFSAVSTSNQFLTTAAAAVAGTWSSSNLSATAVAATFTRGAGTWTAGAALMLQDAAGTTPFTLSAEL